ncbi:hypothetical protein CEUSTIGMA_g5607.t1 [Chlamydomonas eustigma]|uniref:Uncharacterized protein n=1 Tax=Chlamydomonas eustigma TaxID=1157962 RepID=A0A250X507_9CHLO|nr:hypothetical protein CEUSTIGMA_g5607.t1 [Chlamydomonas eustigma]|eukprot:GAX78165.1 hypothetical protein CEUSTIGMA_g5607.t1 [Chlamydomonas eustigma]
MTTEVLSIALDLIPHLDVLVVTDEHLARPEGEDKTKFCALPQKQVPLGVDRWDLPSFNTEHLLKQEGFRMVSKSCVILHIPGYSSTACTASTASTASTSSTAKDIKDSPGWIEAAGPESENRDERRGHSVHQQQGPFTSQFDLRSDVLAPPPHAPGNLPSSHAIAPSNVRPRIITLFVNGHTLPELPGVVSGHGTLHACLAESYRESDDRPGLFMTGLRCNGRQFERGGGDTQRYSHVGYYKAKTSKARANLANPNSAVYRSVQHTASAMSRLEARIAPFIAARRMAVKDLAHPGILPGISREEVPAYALGASKGFINHIHEDEMYGGLTGTITWDNSRLPQDAGYTFCIWPAQVLLDLQAHHASCVMIPGDIMHGTPGLPPRSTTQGSLHQGLGVVTITTENMSYHLTKQQMAVLHRRLTDAGPYGSVFAPFRGGDSLFMPGTTLYCKWCGSYGSPSLCTDCSFNMPWSMKRSMIRQM